MWFRLSNLSQTVNFSNGENPWTKKNENKKKKKKNHIRLDGYIEIVGEIDEIHKQGPKSEGVFKDKEPHMKIFQLGLETLKSSFFLQSSPINLFN